MAKSHLGLGGVHKDRSAHSQRLAGFILGGIQRLRACSQMLPVSYGGCSLTRGIYECPQSNFD